MVGEGEDAGYGNFDGWVTVGHEDFRVMRGIDEVALEDPGMEVGILFSLKAVPHVASGTEGVDADADVEGVPVLIPVVRVVADDDVMVALDKCHLRWRLPEEAGDEAFIVDPGAVRPIRVLQLQLLYGSHHCRSVSTKRPNLRSSVRSGSVHHVGDLTALKLVAYSLPVQDVLDVRSTEDSFRSVLSHELALSLGGWALSTPARGEDGRVIMVKGDELEVPGGGFRIAEDIDMCLARSPERLAPSKIGRVKGQVMLLGWGPSILAAGHQFDNGPIRATSRPLALPSDHNIAMLLSIALHRIRCVFQGRVEGRVCQPCWHRTV